MPRSVVAATVAVVVLAAGIGAVAVAAGEGNGSEQGGRAAPVDQPNERFFADGAQFAVECGFSHSAPVDPIVWPGQTGRSHRHDFFGATAVDAGSTGADLVESPTTCRVGADTAAYWAPSLMSGGQPVTPTARLRTTGLHRGSSRPRSWRTHSGWRRSPATPLPRRPSRGAWSAGAAGGEDRSRRRSPRVLTARRSNCG